MSYFYTRNLQGDITDVYYFDSKGMRKSVASYSYDAWGLVNASNIDNPFRYRGYYYDNETGLYFLQTRFYDPQVKRFLNADSLFIAGDEVTGANMYAYCNGNPVMYSDPSGCAGEDSREIVGWFFAILFGFTSILEMLPAAIQPAALKIVEDIIAQSGTVAKLWGTFKGIMDDVRYVADCIYGEGRSSAQMMQGIATLLKNRYYDTSDPDFQGKSLKELVVTGGFTGFSESRMISSSYNLGSYAGCLMYAVILSVGVRGNGSLLAFIPANKMTESHMFNRTGNDWYEWSDKYNGYIYTDTRGITRYIYDPIFLGNEDTFFIRGGRV